MIKVTIVLIASELVAARRQISTSNNVKLPAASSKRCAHELLCSPGGFCLLLPPGARHLCLLKKSR